MLHLPVGKVRLKFGKIANPPDMVAAAMVFAIFPSQGPAGDLFAHRNRFEHGAVAAGATAHVVDFAGPWIEKEFVESADQVGAVNVVSYLFALVSENFVRRSSSRALHQVRKETVQLSTRVIWSGEASPAEAGGFHSEVTAIFLDEDIGGKFGNSK